MKFSQKLAVHISTESRGASLYLCVHEREHILEPHEVRNLDDKKNLDVFEIAPFA